MLGIYDDWDNCDGNDHDEDDTDNEDDDDEEDEDDHPVAIHDGVEPVSYGEHCAVRKLLPVVNIIMINNIMINIMINIIMIRSK